MLPSITIFGQTYHFYTLIGIAAVFAASGIAYTRAKKYELSYFDMLLGILVLGIGLVIGGVTLFAIINFSSLWERRETVESAWAFLQLLFGGMVFYGGLFGVLAALPIYANVIKRKTAVAIAIAVPILPLAHGIMRIGCFMGGCCYGIESDFLGITFTQSVIESANYVPRLPIQLFETAGNLLIFATIWLYTRRERAPIHILCVYLVPYAVMRFFLEFLRGDPVRGFIFGLSTSQFISLLVLAVCACALAVAKICNERQQEKTLTKIRAEKPSEISEKEVESNEFP